MVIGPPGWTRAMRPFALLALYALVIRGLPERMQPAVPSDDCAIGESRDRGQIGRLERCLATYSDDVELMTELGASYEAAGQGDRAEAIYRRSLAIDPDDGDVHLRLGELLWRRGDVAGAGREAADALKLQPGRRRVLDLLRRTQAGPSGAAQ
jgi:tetratricopeptide (TPR) repeat protein